MRTRYCIRDVQRVDFREWFSFRSGSHYNPNENVLISIMLRSCVRARWKESASMLSVEAAGNNEPLSRAPGLQARRGAQDFRQCNIKVDTLMDVSK